jgi:hypothetical protein
MSRPFQARIYVKEYNKGRGAWATHPRAMASKTVESFCLRRAFDVSLTSQEEMGQDTPIVRNGEWKHAGQAFSAAVGELSREQRRALKAELIHRFGHSDIHQFTTPELRMLTREIRTHLDASRPADGMDLSA